MAIGLELRLLAHIMALYSTPSANVRVNGHPSDVFTINNGTHQGCPLSPLIYIFTLEPLLNRLRTNPDIQVLTLGDREFKVAAFADDILLSLKLPWITLPNLLKDIEYFGSLSNLKINYSKSPALNVTFPLQEVTHCQESFLFLWKKDAITYLGTQITSRLADLYTQNFLMALTKVQKHFKDWMGLNVSWFGHSALVEMATLPNANHPDPPPSIILFNL